MNAHYKKKIFQGRNKNVCHEYFEGWYMKQVNKGGDKSISFIPGVSYGKIDSHAFVQVIICDENNKITSQYFKYDLDEVTFSDNPFGIKVAGFNFCDTGFSVDLSNEEVSISGKIEFGELTTLPASIFEPNIMGFFSYIPNMQCNHDVISMDHSLNGHIELDGEIIDFSGGRGYIEKDWGTTFPKEYIWIQCNHFNVEGVSFLCAIADIPFAGKNFRGFLCSLMHDGKEYRFATYNGSRVKINKKEKYLDITLTNRKYQLRLKGKSGQVESLISPKSGGMNGTIDEALRGKLQLILMDKEGNLLLKTSGHNAGVEVMM